MSESLRARATMLLSRERRTLWVPVVSGLLGFRIGMVGLPSWRVFVETAQVLAGPGLSSIQPTIRSTSTHTKLWTVIHQTCAVALRLGVSEMVTRAGWELALPLAAQNASLKLYRIPAESGMNGAP